MGNVENLPKVFYNILEYLNIYHFSNKTFARLRPITTHAFATMLHRIGKNFQT